MKILIYMPYATWTPHLGTDLEIALNHLKSDDEIHTVQCSGSISSCEPNYEHAKWICKWCQSCSKNGLNLIKIPKENRHLLNLNHNEKSISFPKFNSIDELKEFKYCGVDVGSAVFSSLVSMLRDPEPNIKNYQDWVIKNLKTSIAVYFSIKSLLHEIKPDIFYLFNGRLAPLRPALRAAQELKIKTYVHERAGVNEKYSLTENTYPHDLEYIKKEITVCWTQFNQAQEKYIQLAQHWYEEKRAGKDQSWYSFTKHQARDSLPRNFNPSKRNIVIFNSSEDEFAAIEGWQNPLYKIQQEALEKILSFHFSDDIHFYLRVHPNLQGIDNSQTRNIAKLKAKNFTIIPAYAIVDSYALLDAAEKVITFGSTIGIEACFWNKPSILVGRAFYEHLDACYVPKTHEEFMALIHAPLIPKSKTGALIYGYWSKVYGYPFHHYKPDNLFQGKFLGKSISGESLYLRTIRKWHSIKQKMEKLP